MRLFESSRYLLPILQVSSVGRFCRPMISLTLAAIVVLMVAAPAQAHSRYTRSEPADGAQVESAPFVLKSWYSQELMLRSKISVVSTDGTQVDLGDGRVDQEDPDRKVMLVSLPALPEGSYTVRWLAWSAEDGHDAEGEFTFIVGAAAGWSPPLNPVPQQEES